ncbi:MAG: hypothetical protein ACXVHB_29740 [Solirubrobacteraceae bacterium]
MLSGRSNWRSTRRPSSVLRKTAGVYVRHKNDCRAAFGELRESGDEHVLEGLPELVIEGLAADEARLLLDTAIPGPLDERVKARILGAARGNPLALIELPRGLMPAELAVGFGLADARPLASRIEHTYLRRVEAPPREAQLLLLTAAAEPLGDLSLLWRAAGVSGSVARRCVPPRPSD